MKHPQSANKHQQNLWAAMVLGKWLHIRSKEADYGADLDDDDADDNEDDPESDSDNEDFGRHSRFGYSREDEAPAKSNEFNPSLRRQKSLTLRSQYINKKELRVCAGTWNVGGKLPPNDLDIDDWLGIDQPADIYVLGLQEIVPLNPGNIFVAADTRPVPKWENLIRETLNRVQPKPSKIKSFSDPPSPSKFKPSVDAPDIEEEILLESDSDIGEEVHPLDEEQHNNVFDNGIDNNNPITDEALNTSLQAAEAADIANSRRLNRLNCFRNDHDSSENIETTSSQQIRKLSKMVSGSERIGLTWPEPPLNLLPQRVLERPVSFKPVKSFQATKSFRNSDSFKSKTDAMDLLADIDLEALMKRKTRPSYVKIVSKQMVGIFISIWVRRSLRKHIQNLKMSTVGVGVMGYIGNKGSISVSMSVYQTLFCFICSHLTAGEKEADEIKRNVDVREIHQRTHFYSISDIGLPKTILDHERIIWLGDLNYRISLSYDKTRELISKKQWSKLVERDQLVKELEKGVFDGWSEGTLNFPPTYKYEINSEKYYGEDPKVGRRTPAWCDRILSYGNGMRLMSYKRNEIKFSDHRPVSATYMAEVEVFSPRKLQKALTFTDAEVENEEIINNFGTWNLAA
ncbi:type IV inositol polyphosphate 5-phosphatase 3-like [Cicer arietinum]|uniref:Type IV inositol polyphosphate 5-phosphatase 3-like n=1 Tax=Cicer arietinum TaxID=3827 RepID=A0A1S2XYB4_CICAR|nr:type IV inositol polyphosphate 5-phosphatase 3-like [Cicer arietinum]XP_004496425.1 type IV inositol polyphosphate 5-phosphatase 3-like [Cicer arietinum]XP_004496426.1 type IV inositol polyphosphate 5-phosphatase 3-like [Cicer arietinum]